MGRVAGFLHDIRSTGQSVDTSDTTPPAPPIIDRLPEYTNKTSVEITGGQKRALQSPFLLTIQRNRLWQTRRELSTMIGRSGTD